MNEVFFVIGFLGAIGVSILTLIVTIWIRSGKGIPGWIMAASTVVLVIGLSFVAMLIFGNPFNRFRYPTGDQIAAIGFGGMSLAAVLFAIGFLWDRDRRSRED